MTKFYSISFFLFLAVVLGCNQANSNSEQTENENNSSEEQMLTANQEEAQMINEDQKVEANILELSSKDFGNKVLNKDVLLIDVRTKDEFNEGHIPNAYNVDVTDPNFKSNLVKFKKEKPVYIYCRSGGRSGKAMDIMQEMGFTNLIELENGFLEWTSESMPTTK